MISGLLHNVVNLTDTAFMGRVGEVELGAVGLAAMFYFIFAMIGNGLGIGVQIMVARRQGEGKSDAEVGQIANTGMQISAGLGFVLMLLFLFLSGPLMHLTLDSPRVADAASIYLRFRAPEIMLLMVATTLRGFFSGIGRNTVLIYTTLMMATSNFLFNYVLVFGKWGFPAMGIAGSALATVMAEALAFVVLLVYVHRTKIWQQYKLFAVSAWDAPLAASIFKLSGPTILQYLLSMGSFYVFLSANESMGEHSLAVTNLVRGLFILFMIPTWGFTTASNSIASNLMGQQKFNEVIPAIRKVILMSAAFWAVMAIGFIAFAPDVIGIYTSNERLISDSLAPGYFVTLLSLLFTAAFIALSGVTGVGATRKALYFEIMATSGYLLYIYLGTNFFNVDTLTIWGAEIVYDSILFTAALLYLRFGAWRSLKV
jgi:putative MATE family efflux protein